MSRLNNASLDQALAAVCKIEPRFEAVLEQQGRPSLRETKPGLESLLQIVTEQFLSLQAAAAIWNRVSLRLGPCEPATVLACSPDEMLSLGLSRAKVRSFHGIAQAVRDKRFEPLRLAGCNDEDARQALMALPGVGPWTADIYLLTAELRPDVWPWGDLALQVSAQSLFDLPERPQGKAMQAVGGRFAPWRAVAARLLWSHYRGLKGLKQP